VVPEVPEFYQSYLVRQCATECPSTELRSSVHRSEAIVRHRTRNRFYLFEQHLVLGVQIADQMNQSLSAEGVQMQHETLLSGFDFKVHSF
jgi:hypothetical protein